MSLDTRNYGTSPFGTSPRRVVPSSQEFNIALVEALAKDLVKVSFEQDVVVNKAYLKLDNYTILKADGNAWPILKVLPPQKHQAQDYVLLNVRPQVDAEVYFIQARNLVSRIGAHVSLADVGWQYHTTKVDAVVASMPNVYAVQPGWNIRAILNAVATEDNIIGGPGIHNIT